MKKKASHCYLCEKTIIANEDVVMDIGHSITHAECNYLASVFIVDQGKFNEVVKRNYQILKKRNRL